jgi:4-aminobutyrate aminotransferase-like enzyme
MESLTERRKRLLGSRVRQYYDTPFHPVRGKGVWLYDADGRAFLDAYNNVPHVGYCHPDVVDAICNQTSTLNTNTRYLYDSILEYADRLVGLMPPELNVCAFTCTGSEANDLAWRMAKCATGGDGAITTKHGYHGNTTFLDSIDGSSSKTNRRPAPWWSTVPAPTASHNYPGTGVTEAIELLRRNGYKPAAFFVDSTFCSDGIHIPVSGSMEAALRELRKAGALIIADELQASLGRLGEHLWSWERLNVVPDIVTLGKPMGNGEPIGIVVTRREILETFQANERYFNTFAGNPVSCVAGTAVLDVMARENLQDNAKRVGRVMREGLDQLAAQHKNIREVRGLGFLYGVEICKRAKPEEAGSQEARWLLNEIFRRGILVGLTGPNRNAMNVLKIRPPMVFSLENAGQFLDVLDGAFSALEQHAW